MQMQDSWCHSDIDCTYRKLKISYEWRDLFLNFSFFRTSECFSNISKLKFGTFFFLRNFKNLKNSKIKTFRWTRFGTDAPRKMMEIRLNNSWKSWIWDQYLSNNTKWKFGNIDQIFSKHQFLFKTMNGHLVICLET